MEWIPYFDRNGSYTRSIDEAGLNPLRGVPPSACFDRAFGQPLMEARAVEIPYYSRSAFERVPPWARPVEIFMTGRTPF